MNALPLDTVDEWLNFEVWEALTDPFVGAVGEPMLALLVLGPIAYGYYTYQDSGVMPLILLVLIGGSTLVYAPAGVGSAVIALAVVSVAGLGYWLLQAARS